MHVSDGIFRQYGRYGRYGDDEPEAEGQDSSDTGGSAIETIGTIGKAAIDAAGNIIPVIVGKTPTVVNPKGTGNNKLPGSSNVMGMSPTALLAGAAAVGAAFYFLKRKR